MMNETLKIVCRSCNGTGLYRGMGERNGCAVVCRSCHGSGCEEIQFERFKERKRITNKPITRVFKDSFGFVHTCNDIEGSDIGRLIRFTQGGCTYDEWLNGIEPKPVKDLYCPLYWTHQSMKNRDVNNLYKNYCSVGCGIGCKISSCYYFENKEACWEIFEGKKENMNQ